MSGTGGRPSVDAAQTGGAHGGSDGGVQAETGGRGSGGSGASAGGGGSGGRGGGGSTGGGGGGCARQAGCCASDADCLSTEECVNPTVCTAGQPSTGVCKPKPASPVDCWRAEDCTFRQCFGAQVCPCGAACLVADKLGGCAMP